VLRTTSVGGAACKGCRVAIWRGSCCHPNSFLTQQLVVGRCAPRPSMSESLRLFAASFLLSVSLAPTASANLVCIEGAGGACTKWSNGISCLQGAGMACSRWSNGLTCGQGGGTACVRWSNDVFCLRGAGHHCTRWSNGSHCVALGARECVEWTGEGFF
jgi:hypothetical protein